MDTKHETVKMSVVEQGQYLMTLSHDEFLESVISGGADDYLSWTEFMHWCLDRLVDVPEQR